MKLLFICTHNRCRSILAEAITNQFGQGRWVAKSAGSQPEGKVHPLSLRYLSEAKIPTEGLFSKSWDVHKSWHPDVVITLCDTAAGESCPIWFEDSIKVHWGLPDPSKSNDSEDNVAQAFRHTIYILKNRIEKLNQTNIEPLNKEDLLSLFKRIGES